MIPPHVPTDASKAKVEQTAGLGLPQDQIAAVIGISAPTLRKYYEVELAVGKAKASASIADTLYNKAMAGDTTAMIWWSKAQMGWGERNTTVLSNPDGSPVEGIKVTFVKPSE
jgi:hypothetical protein